MEGGGSHSDRVREWGWPPLKGGRRVLSHFLVPPEASRWANINREKQISPKLPSERRRVSALPPGSNLSLPLAPDLLFFRRLTFHTLISFIQC